MHRTITTSLWTCGLALLLVNVPARADEENSVKAAEKTLQDAKLQTDGASLLEFLRLRTLTQTEQIKVEAQIKQLGADSFRARELATAGLIKRGPVVIELLRNALKNADLEMTRRIKHCLERIQEKDYPPQVPTAVARLIRERKPADAVEVLFSYLPFADHDSVADEVRSSLAALAVTHGKSSPVLVAGLNSKSALLRGAAGEALCRAKAADQKEAVRKLLQDNDPSVRARVAMALVLSGERDGVPVLVRLLPELGQTQAWQAEDMLLRLAEGKEPPTLSVGGDRDSREKARDAWLGWWKKHGEKADLAVLHTRPRLLGYTTVVLLDKGQVLELGQNDQERWKISNLVFPLDVQVLPGDRVLVAEYHAARVTERNLKGEIVWQKRINGPLVAQRLENGHTFIATDSELIEVDRSGEKELHRFSLPDGERIMKAAKLPNGEIVCLTSDPAIRRLDGMTGRELKRFPINLSTRLFGGRIHMLPNGRVLVPHNAENKVVEYDANGKAIWEVNVEQPVAAVRLPNGNTLVTTMTQNRAVEFNRAGTEVWQWRSDTRVTRAFRR